MKNKYILPVSILMLSLFAFTVNAQNYEGIISSYMTMNKSSLDLKTTDLNFEITSATTLTNKEVKVVYLLQTFNNVRVTNASATVTIINDEVTNFKHRFVKNLSDKVIAGRIGMSPVQAVQSATAELGLTNSLNVFVTDETTRQDVRLESLSSESFSSEMYYELDDNSSNYVLTYDTTIKDPSGPWWKVKINAATGQIVKKYNLVISCNFDNGVVTDQKILDHSKHSHTSIKNGQSVLIDAKSKSSLTSAIAADGAIYNAYPLRVESPSHGDRVLLIDPAVVAPNVDGEVPSPFGWHDFDGEAGPDFTTTDGNNVNAYLDTMDDDTPTVAPIDGGSNLVFDHPIDFSMEPSTYRPAVITNLYVWNNYTHDVWYNYGFDETSGNFQTSDYGRFAGTGTGFNGDPVQAEAQDGSELPAPTLNNANMATGADGSPPRMQMFLWGAAPFGDFFEVITPGDLEGSYFASRFPFVDIPRIENGEDQIRANIVVVEDDGLIYLGDDGGTPGASPDTNDGCTALVNAADISGNIAIIRRGVCTFATKIGNAQDAGAIAAIIVNNVEGEGPVNGGGTPDDPITIPSVSIGQVQGDAIIAALDGGDTIEGRIIDRGPLSATVMKDGDVDQGIIAHEYGHGISTRLVGGRNQSICLLSLTFEEQMGEGWSDWIALVMTQELDDTPEQPRGIGTYVLNQDNLGSGIRPARYSTDFTVNDYTYGDLPNDEVTVPHGVGFVWATMLWDMYWALIDKHGFDPDMYNGTGGNNIAMRLVLDGLKLLPCGPGIVDGRDAILEADANINGGENECEIRNAFAQRGVGALAIQGTALSRSDQIENFDLDGGLFTTNCTDILSTNDINNTVFSIYPNPSNGFVNINSNKNTGLAKVEMFDINGRQVLNTEIDLTNTGRVNTSNLTAGVYVIKIVTNNATHTQKLIIN